MGREWTDNDITAHELKAKHERFRIKAIVWGVLGVATIIGSAQVATCRSADVTSVERAQAEAAKARVEADKAKSEADLEMWRKMPPAPSAR
jgi:hypothetical protein